MTKVRRFLEAAREDEIASMARMLRENGSAIEGIVRSCDEAAGKPVDRATVLNWLKHTGRTKQ